MLSAALFVSLILLYRRNLLQQINDCESVLVATVLQYDGQTPL